MHRRAGRGDGCVGETEAGVARERGERDSGAACVRDARGVRVLCARKLARLSAQHEYTGTHPHTHHTHNSRVVAG